LPSELLCLPATHPSLTRAKLQVLGWGPARRALTTEIPPRPSLDQSASLSSRHLYKEAQLFSPRGGVRRFRAGCGLTQESSDMRF
jgi:hypothetical protein